MPRPNNTPTFWQLIAFLTVGTAAAATYAVLTIAVIRLTAVSPVPASIAIYCLVIPVAFFAQRRLVFGSTAAPGRQFRLYCAMQVSCAALLAWGGVGFFTGHFLIDSIILFVMAGLAALLSYALCHYVIFPRSSAGGL